MHEQSLRTVAEDVAAATILIERARADQILADGAADALWPSDTAASEIAARLARLGRRALFVEHRDAGHSPVLPREAWSESESADRALGTMIWDAVVASLGLSRSAAP